MSTKTNFKRVALVAVAALGLGVLSSVAPANAGVLTKNDVFIVPATANSLAAAGVCAIDPKALAADITSVTSTATVIQVGASLTFNSTTNGNGSLVISGPATWTSASTNSVSLDAKILSSSSATALNSPVLTASAVGSITVTAQNAVDGGGSAVEAFGITVVASCTSADVPVAANTVLILSHQEETGVTGSSTETPLTYAQSEYTVADVHVNVLLRNAYKAELGTEGVLTASATNGALIAFDSGSLLASTAFVQTKADLAANVDLKVAQNKIANPGQALSTTITFQFNGVTVGTKDVKLYGVGSKVVVSDVTVGTENGSTGTFKYVVQDNAGNQIDTPDASLNGAKAGITFGSIVTDAAGVAGTGSTTLLKGSGTFTCAASKSGSQDIAVGFINSALASVKSNTFTATCGSSTVDTFSVSMDKASYSPGEIATLTIKGLDSRGGIVSDAATHGAGVSSLSIPGMTIIGSAATSSDKFTAGALTYKFRVDQAEGNFVGQALVTATVDTKAETVSYSIKSTSGGVSNADVLKAIVSLIASINKQIAALQKALLKK